MSLKDKRYWVRGVELLLEKNYIFDKFGENYSSVKKSEDVDLAVKQLKQRILDNDEGYPYFNRLQVKILISLIEEEFE